MTAIQNIENPIYEEEREASPSFQHKEDSPVSNNSIVGLDDFKKWIIKKYDIALLCNS